MSFKLVRFLHLYFDFDGRPYNTLTLPCERVITTHFTTPCKSDEVTHAKQHKSFFWDNVIARSHDHTPGSFSRIPIISPPLRPAK